MFLPCLYNNSDLQCLCSTAEECSNDSNLQIICSNLQSKMAASTARAWWIHPLKRILYLKIKLTLYETLAQNIKNVLYHAMS